MIETCIKVEIIMKILRPSMFATVTLTSSLILMACNAQSNSSKFEQKAAAETAKTTSVSRINQTYQVKTIAQFNEPWAMAALNAASYGIVVWCVTLIFVRLPLPAILQTAISNPSTEVPLMSPTMVLS